MQVVFSESQDPYRPAGIGWMAQLFEPPASQLEIPYPRATAYVSDYGWCQFLDFVMVPDHLRRRGYATRVIEACYRRWPNLQLTDGINEAGEALVAKFQRKDGE